MLSWYSDTETPAGISAAPPGSLINPADGRARERQARRLLPPPACVCVPLDAAVTLQRLVCEAGARKHKVR